MGSRRVARQPPGGLTRKSSCIVLTFSVNIIERRWGVEIDFEDPGLEADCNEYKQLVRKHNTQRAKLVRRRLDDLRAAPTLEVMRSLPGRCHELKSDRDGQLSIDLDGPYRLIFRPEHTPIPVK